MLSKTPFRIAGAAILGTVALLGTNAANAQISVDADGKVMGAVSYARETLATHETDDLDGYYMLTEDSNVHNVALGGLQFQDTDEFALTVTLENMAFGAALANSVLAIAGGGSVQTPRLGMGGVGESMAMFSFSTNAASGADDGSILTVDIGNLAIAEGADSGSISLSLLNKSTRAAFGGITGLDEQKYSDAIKVVKGLTENFEAAEGDLVASVDTGFKEFKSDSGSTMVGSLGTLNLEIRDETQNAADGSDIADVNDLILVDGTNLVTADAFDGSTFTIMGNVSFMSRMWLETAADADGNAPGVQLPPCDFTENTDIDLRNKSDEDEETYEMESLKSSVSAIDGTDTMQLCISVPGEEDEDAMQIQAGDYAVSTSYEATSMTQALTPADDTHALASIVRDGVTVHLPYLTTADKYNQRVFIVNRSGGPITYHMEFDAATGAATSEGPHMLAAGTNILDVGGDNGIVTTMNGARTSGMLMIEAGKDDITVSTVQIHRETGASDTVVYDNQ